MNIPTSSLRSGGFNTAFYSQSAQNASLATLSSQLAPARGLKTVNAIKKSKGNEFSAILTKFESLLEQNKALETQFELKTKKLGKDLGLIYQLQNSAHKLSFSIELFAKTTETLSSSLRRLQQMGAS